VEVGRTGSTLKVYALCGLGVVTVSPGSLIVIENGPGVLNAGAKRRTRPPVDAGLVVVVVGIGNNTLTTPKIGLFGSITVVPVMLPMLSNEFTEICDADDKLAASR